MTSRILLCRPLRTTAKYFYNDISVWLECFMVYISIYDGIHGDNYPEVRRAMIKFAGSFSRQAKECTADATIKAALACLGYSLRHPRVAESWDSLGIFRPTEESGSYRNGIGRRTETS